MADDEGDQRQYAWRVLALNVLVVSQPALTATMLTLALPELADQFSIGASSLAVLVSGYWLVSTVLLLSFGGLADLLGRRILYILGIAVFTVGAVGCAIAPSAAVLIAMRLLQGVGAAAIMANGTALLTDAFPAKLLSTAMGITGSVFSIFGLAGPMLGGFLATAFGGRAVFWFSVPFGVLGLVVATALLHRTESAPSTRPQFDALGAVLSAMALTGLMLLLSQGATWGWTSTLTVGVAIVTMALFLAFGWLELRRRHPLLDLQLFADWSRSAAYLAHGLVAASDLSIALLMSLYFQQVMQLSALDAGLRLLPITIGAIVAAPVAGRLAAYLPSRVLSSCGAALHAAALLILVLGLGPGLSYVMSAGCLAAIGVGSAFFGTPNTHAIMASVPAEQRGVANSLRSTIQNASGLAGTAFVLALVGGSAAHADTSIAPFQTATLTLCALCTVATVVSLLRGPTRLSQSVKQS